MESNTLGSTSKSKGAIFFTRPRSRSKDLCLVVVRLYQSPVSRKECHNNNAMKEDADQGSPMPPPQRRRLRGIANPTSTFLLVSSILAPSSSAAFAGQQTAMPRPRTAIGSSPRRSSRLAALIRDEAATKTDAEWRQALSPEAYDVLRRDGTEPPNSSYLNDIKAGTDEGAFTCAGCSSPLFLASSKFESGTGWPSFFAPLDGDAIDLSVDFKLILPRTEVRCKNCGGHLGHVFDDGPRPTGKRYCLNGVALDFVRDGTDLDLMKDTMDRAQRAASIEEAGGVVVTQPLAAVLPGAAVDGILSGLFLVTFAHKVTAGDLRGFGAAGPVAVLEFFPLAMGAFLAFSAAKKLASALR